MTFNYAQISGIFCTLKPKGKTRPGSAGYCLAAFDPKNDITAVALGRAVPKAPCCVDPQTRQSVKTPAQLFTGPNEERISDRSSGRGSVRPCAALFWITLKIPAPITSTQSILALSVPSTAPRLAALRHPTRFPAKAPAPAAPAAALPPGRVDRGDLRPAEGPALPGAPRRPHDARPTRQGRPAAACSCRLRLHNWEIGEPGRRLIALTTEG